jgi:hypothetical protein
LSLTPSAISSAPKAIAYEAMIQTTATAPAPGLHNISAPKIIDSTPDSASSHSFSITLRKRIAATIWKTHHQRPGGNEREQHERGHAGPEERQDAGYDP